eukprot:CAMPEP_0173401514 /NCGR_PEP_ID=MMETSP1356-20130122/51168_1 /TAXON_ID=77927 ORGANISM="Hemiselmis virescens, Strain PCC157" /NCGR_SAMPLE_ID=MMETSP1356 /ASSEMBLY_ACC=CAM_ASM_000847 /LENGTH=44 /DNA_ID= /DNA_START= /DNA_END= /DNA_ORIENTATION=
MLTTDTLPYCMPGVLGMLKPGVLGMLVGIAGVPGTEGPVSKPDS